MVKPRDYNEIKPPIGKNFRNINQSDIILFSSENNCRSHLETKFTKITTGILPPKE